MFKISDLRSKDIINTQDGKKLGAIKDIELDLSEGRIQAIILPGPGKFLRLFGRSDDIIVPWEQIKKIGRDVVLVELDDFHSPSNHGARPGPGRNNSRNDLAPIDDYQWK
ncbi:MAG: YlmC/YmxH family sporulation protein [Peptococcaceae bacterium]|nr:YlmC/YmxH family sporulation protein [Peptococcaceae bacterium]